MFIYTYVYTYIYMYIVCKYIYIGFRICFIIHRNSIDTIIAFEDVMKYVYLHIYIYILHNIIYIMHNYIEVDSKTISLRLLCNMYIHLFRNNIKFHWYWIHLITAVVYMYIYVYINYMNIYLYTYDYRIIFTFIHPILWY